jgi:hypothetical protein
MRLMKNLDSRAAGLEMTRLVVINIAKMRLFGATGFSDSGLREGKVRARRRYRSHDSE